MSALTELMSSIWMCRILNIEYLLFSTGSHSGKNQNKYSKFDNRRAAEDIRSSYVLTILRIYKYISNLHLYFQIYNLSRALHMHQFCLPITYILECYCTLKTILIKCTYILSMILDMSIYLRAVRASLSSTESYCSKAS